MAKILVRYENKSGDCSEAEYEMEDRVYETYLMVTNILSLVGERTVKERDGDNRSRNTTKG